MEGLMSLIWALVVLAVCLVGKSKSDQKKKSSNPDPSQKTGSVSKPSFAELTDAARKNTVPKTVKPKQPREITFELTKNAQTTFADLVKEAKSAASDALKEAVETFEQENIEDTPIVSRNDLPMDEENPNLENGQSVQDADGCIGGSLGEHTEEGESQAEHAEHLQRLQAEREHEEAVIQGEINARNLRLNELRRAVIMAEILDKPKALRRR